MTRTASKPETSPDVYEAETVWLHTAVHVGPKPSSSFSILKTPQNPEPAKLKLLPMGLLIEFKGERVITCYANCTRIKLKG